MAFNYVPRQPISSKYYNSISPENIKKTYTFLISSEGMEM